MDAGENAHYHIILADDNKAVVVAVYAASLVCEARETRPRWGHHISRQRGRETPTATVASMFPMLPRSIFAISCPAVTDEAAEADSSVANLLFLV